jgi:hypothetical protein
MPSVTVPEDDLAVGPGLLSFSSSFSSSESGSEEDEFDSESESESDSDSESATEASVAFLRQTLKSGLLLTDIPESELNVSCRLQVSGTKPPVLGDGEREHERLPVDDTSSTITLLFPMLLSTEKGLDVLFESTATLVSRFFSSSISCFESRRCILAALDGIRRFVRSLSDREGLLALVFLFLEIAPLSYDL